MNKHYNTATKIGKDINKSYVIYCTSKENIND